MKLPVYTEQKMKAGQAELPLQFAEAYRPDLIRRAVLSLERGSQQRYGAFAGAGLRHSSKLSKRRRHYRGSYGMGISRVNRKIMSRRGMRMFWVGAFSPQTRGGHRAHPPKAEKKWREKINIQERRKAIRSAIAATINTELVRQRGHLLPQEYPFIVMGSLEDSTRTHQVEEALMRLGFEQELARSSLRKIRAGKGKLRGRKNRQRKGLLIVTSSSCPLLKAARNLPGVDAVPVRALNAALLAPGALPGRVTLWTEKALQTLEQEKLFT